MLPLSIYIHWPFCKSKCPYCDFNSHVRDSVDHARWRAALLRELAEYAERLPGRRVESIFFGGGTPSLMEPETVAALIDAVGRHWQMAPDAEITLEANPTSVEAEKFRAFRKAGVNRVSLGVQSLYASELKFLGREHSAQEAEKAVELARDIFPRYSFDLIYARPGQALAAWEAELRTALALAGDHLSLYQLTIEENTAFHHAYHSGKFVMPEDGLAADMYLLTQDIMEAHGLPAYEISNHARPGEESRHNIVYWQSGDAIGIGPGAHGRFYRGRAAPDSASAESHDSGTRIATENIKSPELWLAKVEREGRGLQAETALSARESFEEEVMMGLRLSTGIKLRPEFSRDVLAQLAGQGLVEITVNHMKTTRQGRLLLNSVTRALLASTD